MTRTLPRRPFRRCWFVPRPPRAESATPARHGGWRAVVWALLAAGLVFCHGCHGDEDNELCAPLTPRVRQADNDAKRTADVSALGRTPRAGPVGSPGR
jgi:hypothetical protein